MHYSIKMSFASPSLHSKEPEAFLPVLLGGGRRSHRLRGVLLVGCGGLGSGGLWWALRRVYLPCAYHLPFLQTKVMLYAKEKKKKKKENAENNQLWWVLTSQKAKRSSEDVCICYFLVDNNEAIDKMNQDPKCWVSQKYCSTKRDIRTAVDTHTKWKVSKVHCQSHDSIA